MVTSSRLVRTASHELAQTARQRLHNAAYASIRGLTYKCDDRGVLYLRGQLSSYYQKQLAQEAVAGPPGIVRVLNQAEVADDILAGANAVPNPR
jgi:hypothetical protein